MSILEEIASDPHLHFADDGGPKRRVFLNGEEVKFVWACRCSSNTLPGWVEATEFDANGCLVIDRDEVQTRIVEGDVRVEVID